MPRKKRASVPNDTRSKRREENCPSVQSSTTGNSLEEELPCVEAEERRALMTRSLLHPDKYPMSAQDLLKCMIDSSLLKVSSHRASKDLEHPINGCSFCSATDLEPRNVVEHRLKCQKKKHVQDWMTNSAIMKNMQTLSTCPCPILTNNNSQCNKVDCSNLLAATNHMYLHLLGWYKNPRVKECPFPGCHTVLDASESTRMDMRVHFQEVHLVLPNMGRAQDVLGIVNLSTFYCDECMIFYTPHASWRAHCSMHLQHLLKQTGNKYETKINGPVVERPGRCPFCLHNEGLDVEERVLGFKTKQVQFNHIQRHIVAVSKVQPKKGAAELARSLDCPIPTCKRGHTSAKDLGNHLVDKHGLFIFGQDGLEDGSGARHWDGDVSKLSCQKKASPKKAQSKQSENTGQSSKTTLADLDSDE